MFVKKIYDSQRAESIRESICGQHKYYYMEITNYSITYEQALGFAYATQPEGPTIVRLTPPVTGALLNSSGGFIAKVGERSKRRKKK